MSTIIVGAGAAGITAGYTLLQEGYDNFVILEASSTYLGRIKKYTNLTNHPIDIGAEFIHVDPDVLNSIVNDPNVELDPSVTTTTPYAPKYFEWDGEVLNTANLPSGDYKFVNSTWYDFFDTYLVPDVIDKIIFNCTVSQIEWTSNTSTTVKCENGQIYNGTKAIITVPISVLQDEDITFVPSLPEDFIAAVNVPTMASGLKVFLRFTTKFYPDAFSIEADFENIVLDESDRFFFDETYGQEQPIYPVLAVFILGDIADRFVSLSDDEIIQQLLSDLDTVFGNSTATDSYVTGLVQNWSNEPYIRGAYSIYGDDYVAIDTLRKPISNVLYFAGEAIPVEESEYANGFVHGAAWSGRLAAMETLSTTATNEGGPTSGSDGPTSGSVGPFDLVWCLIIMIFMSFWNLF